MLTDAIRSQRSAGQGSLEYLLLIGGAVLVAAIVIGLVVSSSQSAGDIITTTTVSNVTCIAKTAYATCVATPGCIPVNDVGVEVTPTTGIFSRCVSRGTGTTGGTGGPTGPTCSTTQRHCQTGLQGVCAAGTQTCSAGVWSACTQTASSTAENQGAGNCSDGLDNDCDGTFDTASSTPDLTCACMPSQCYNCGRLSSAICTADGSAGICRQGISCQVLELP